eukprot:3727533-Pleurochrysis_carterae.AAC.1
MSASSLGYLPRTQTRTSLATPTATARSRRACPLRRTPRPTPRCPHRDISLPPKFTHPSKLPGEFCCSSQAFLLG